jgi:hypothetical protein
MSKDGKTIDKAVLGDLMKKYTFKHILLSIGFNIVSKGNNHALLNDRNGMQLVIGRFDTLDHPVKVYLWPLNQVLSKAGALLYVLDNHLDDWLEGEDFFAPREIENLQGGQSTNEFIFSVPLSVKSAKELCLYLRSFKETANVSGIDLTLLSSASYSFRVYNRTVRVEGNTKEYLTFLLYQEKSKEAVGLQSIEFNEEGRVKEVFPDGVFNGYFTNEKPKGASKGIIFFSFHTFLDSGSYKTFAHEQVFVLPKGSKTDLFLEILIYCKKEGLELNLYFPSGLHLSGADNYVRFNLFYLGFKNPYVGSMDYTGDLLFRKVIFSFEKQKYEMLHFAECYNELRAKCIKFYEGMLLAMDDFKGVIPVADNKLIERYFWCELNFCLKEPLMGFAIPFQGIES